MNLARVDAEVGFTLDAVPEPPPIFKLIQDTGHISAEEMYTVFNMGIGMTVTVATDKANAVLEFIRGQKHQAWLIGDVIEGRGKVKLE